ncbi:ankyrin [Cadophora sp. DSE1049]|nr:ankyrin [Cadophora sp. DSE1049]
MDPVSFAASIITLVSTLNTASKGIKKLIDLKHAPEKLLDVHNKIAKNLAESSSSSDSNVVFRFERLLMRATNTVKEAQHLINNRLTKNPESLDKDGVKISVKKKKFLWDEDKLHSISAQLSDIIQSLLSAISAISATALLSFQATLTAVHFHVTDSRFIDERISTHIQELRPQPESISNHSSPQAEETVAVEDVTGLSDVRSAQASPLIATQTGVVSTTNFANVPTFSERHVKVEFTVEQNAIANRSSQTCMRPSCKTCRKITSKRVRIYYYLPWWMMGRIIQLASGYNASRRLVVSFKASCVVPEDSDVFLYAQHNNLDGIRKLFSQGRASPFDITPTGRTPLHFAATAVRAEMIELLVKQHAETDLEDQDALSPQDIIWELFLRKPEKRRHILTAAGLSPDHTDGLEKQCFTGVHRIILGIGGAFPLDDYLKVNCSEMNDRDLSGKTALAWAASRPDHIPVRILLEHGASLEITDNRYKTPLHYAAGSGAPESVRLILEAIKTPKGDRATPIQSLIEAGDDKSRTPLNYATRMDLFPHTELLLRYGASLDARESKTKRCILLNAIYWNSHQVIPLLISHGAKTNNRDSNGATLLHHIARFADLDTLRLLSEINIGYADPEIQDARGMTPVDAFNSSEARCSPEEGETRQIAIQFFGRILGNVTTGTSDSTPLVEGLDHAQINEDISSEEPNVAGAWESRIWETEEEADLAVEEPNLLEDDQEDIFYDAISEATV